MPFVPLRPLVDDHRLQVVAGVPAVPVAVLLYVQVQPVVDAVFDLLLGGRRELAQHHDQVVGGLGHAGRLHGLGLVLAVLALVEVLQFLSLIVVVQALLDTLHADNGEHNFQEGHEGPTLILAPQAGHHGLLLPHEELIDHRPVLLEVMGVE